MAGARDGLLIIYISAAYAGVMPKLPQERYLRYAIGDSTQHDNITKSYFINACRDLASVNRHNVAQTTSKGVPLVYRMAVTMTPLCNIGSNSESDYNTFDDYGNKALVQQADLVTIPSSWVCRNAVVKTHAARENMFKLQGVMKGERGAYSKTMRLGFEGTSFLDPLKPTNFATPGTYDVTGWDYSTLVQDDHASLPLTFMTGDNGILSLYLDSRKQISEDSNSDDDDTNQPVDSNIIRRLLSPTLGISTKDAIVTALARDEADNPPYSLENDGDHTDPIYAGQLTIGQTVGFSATKVIDVPLGLLKLGFRNIHMGGTVPGGTENSQGVNISVEVLGVYEM